MKPLKLSFPTIQCDPRNVFKDALVLTTDYIYHMQTILNDLKFKRDRYNWGQIGIKLPVTL